MAGFSFFKEFDLWSNCAILWFAMGDHFPAGFFQANRRRLQTLFSGTAPIILTANGLLQRSTDSAYPFTQDGSFWYLTGIDEPNVVLVIDKGREYLIIPELSAVRAAFDGSINSNELTRRSGISEVILEKEGWKRLAARLKRVSSVAVLNMNASYIEGLGMFTNPARKRLVNKLKTHNPNLTFLDLRTHLQKLRTVKQPLELSALTKAVQITSSGLLAVAKKYARGGYSNEFEVEHDLTKYFHKNGGSGHSFDPIVAGAERACVIHPRPDKGPVDTQQPILLDVGARFANYAADISRSWWPEPSKRYRLVHDVVAEVADFALASLKPGVILKDYEKAVEVFMGEKLRSLGLISTIESEEVRRYFPHATSHFLGIDVHDVGDYDQPLEPNTVLTVEPGIYIPKEGIGVRIEDDVVITPLGVKNISSRLPRTI